MGGFWTRLLRMVLFDGVVSSVMIRWDVDKNVIWHIWVLMIADTFTIFTTQDWWWFMTTEPWLFIDLVTSKIVKSTTKSAVKLCKTGKTGISDVLLGGSSAHQVAQAELFALAQKLAQTDGELANTARRHLVAASFFKDVQGLFSWGISVEIRCWILDERM